ncbi:MAG: hypothetical protein KGL53_10385 [Elusimicrobia bacterium]|nr:hypothetical protein [Elusimicrobiota bacterium]
MMEEKINYKFKIGDTVRCIKEFIGVKVGDIRLIENIHSCGDNDYLVLNVGMKDNVSGDMIKVGIPSSHFEIYILGD